MSFIYWKIDYSGGALDLNVNKVFLCRLEKVKIDFYVYNYIISAEKLIGLGFRSAAIQSSIKITRKTSSTLNWVFFTNTFYFISFFFLNLFSSILDCFKVFFYSKVIIVIQSCILVYLVFNVEMSSFVIKIVIEVNREVLADNIVPALRFIIAHVVEFFWWSRSN